jgi:DnaJ-class molecular chaperone
MGSGQVSKAPFDFFGGDEVCPACMGAGEFEVAIPSAKLTTCKFCGGSGIVQSTPVSPFGQPKVCPACKGIGVIERPAVGTEQTGSNEVNIPQTPRLLHYDFEIAVSFAGEDRETVQQYCDILSSKRLKVFYDKYEQIGLWGANLYDKLDEVYRTKALFCVIFISKHYAAKVWTNHERKSAQSRALQENREYVLPVRLDDTEIPGIPPTIGYVDLREISIEKLAEMTIQKVGQLKKQDPPSPNTA